MKYIFIITLFANILLLFNGCDSDSKSKSPVNYEQPLPNEKKVEYDANNRIEKITYPDGTVETFLVFLN